MNSKKKPHVPEVEKCTSENLKKGLKIYLSWRHSPAMQWHPFTEIKMRIVPVSFDGKCLLICNQTPDSWSTWRAVHPGLGNPRQGRVGQLLLQTCWRWRAAWALSTVSITSFVDGPSPSVSTGTSRTEVEGTFQNRRGGSTRYDTSRRSNTNARAQPHLSTAKFPSCKRASTKLDPPPTAELMGGHKR